MNRITPLPSEYAGSVESDGDGFQWNLEHVTILNRDSRDLRPIPSESVQLVITSPPYNVGINYNQHDDVMPVEEYLALLSAVWRECYRVMETGARICVNVPAGVGRNPYVPLADKVTAGLEELFTLRGVIVWDKGTSGNRTSWGSYRQPSDPSLRDTTERIIVAHKGPPGTKLAVPPQLKRRDEKGVYVPFLKDGDLFRQLTQDHWQMSPESKSRVGHPTPFPVELPERLIRLYAYPGATILDPFAGSGTTAVAAIRLGAECPPMCKTYLVDIDYDYCQLALKRCRDELQRVALDETRQEPAQARHVTGLG